MNPPKLDAGSQANTEPAVIPAIANANQTGTPAVINPAGLVAEGSEGG